jgi:DNA-binding NarL/FixJ family response regulator
LTVPLKTRILLADDHEVVRDGLRDYLERASRGETTPEDPLSPRELEVVKLIAEGLTSGSRRADAPRDPARARSPVTGSEWIPAEG